MTFVCVFKCIYLLQLYAHTHDDHFELVVVDFESQDIDVEYVLKSSAIKR